MIFLGTIDRSYFHQRAREGFAAEVILSHDSTSLKRSKKYFGEAKFFVAQAQPPRNLDGVAEQHCHFCHTLFVLCCKQVKSNPGDYLQTVWRHTLRVSRTIRVKCKVKVILLNIRL